VGFEGFRRVRELRDSRLAGVPELHVVYLILRDPDLAPSFLDRSPAGRPKGRDPTLPLVDLRESWLGCDREASPRVDESRPLWGTARKVRAKPRRRRHAIRTLGAETRESSGNAAAKGRAEEEARWSAWMCRANAGDRHAYERLLAEIGDVMERYLRRRFGDSDLVEECVQECLLSIHRARASYQPNRPFRSWMFTIVRHKTIDLLRRRGTRQRHETAAPRGEEVEYRDALILTKLEGHSLGDAARLAGVSITAMKSRVHRGIREVQSLLEREED
jgi:RNA polymerase sigma-70 factor (ECF subfamily)